MHKAPANEVIRGALGVRYPVSKEGQAGLNPDGINCIRSFDGNVKVYGARTLAGQGEPEWRYVNVRRLLNFLRESIDEGTQWVVFEPERARPVVEDPPQRQRVPDQRRGPRARCSAPPRSRRSTCAATRRRTRREVRDLGQVVTEIGVALGRSRPSS